MTNLPNGEEALAYAEGYAAGLADAKDQDVAKLIIERDAAQARYCFEKVLREVRDRDIERLKGRAGEEGSLRAKLAAANEQLARANAGREAEAKAGWIARDKLAAAEVALRQSAEGWANLVELCLLPSQHMATAATLRDMCRAPLTEHAVPETQNGGGDA